MECWEFPLMILCAVFFYYVLFILKFKPYRMSSDRKHGVERLFLFLSWRVSLKMGNDEAWKLIGCYILLLLYIPLYNKIWNYPNFGRRDCCLMVSIQAALFLTRGYTLALFVCIVIGCFLMNYKNRVLYSPDDEPVKEELMRCDKA